MHCFWIKGKRPGKSGWQYSVESLIFILEVVFQLTLFMFWLPETRMRVFQGVHEESFRPTYLIGARFGIWPLSEAGPGGHFMGQNIPNKCYVVLKLPFLATRRMEYPPHRAIPYSRRRWVEYLACPRSGDVKIPFHITVIPYDIIPHHHMRNSTVTGPDGGILYFSPCISTARSLARHIFFFHFIKTASSSALQHNSLINICWSGQENQGLLIFDGAPPSEFVT
jgi:hypothetical protein